MAKESESASEWDLAVMESKLESATESLKVKASGIPWALKWATERVSELVKELSKLRSLQDY